MLSNPVANIVRKATAKVQSTVSNVASTVQEGIGMKRHKDSHATDEDEMLENAKIKLKLEIKGSPNKDARTTQRLAVKVGFLNKRNEQNVYQKRFVCLVPHTFLYYFENEYADSPRGVLDLELFSQISLEGNESNTLKMATYSEGNIR